MDLILLKNLNSIYLICNHPCKHHNFLLLHYNIDKNCKLNMKHNLKNHYICLQKGKMA